MKRKILIIEDEKDLANLIGKSLEDAGFETKIINTGEDALDMFYEFSPNLVLLDINLPKKNGWEICKEIRGIAKTPIIIMTARDTEKEEIYGLELGADDYITKPLNIKIVTIKIKKILKMEEDTFFSVGSLVFDFNQFKVKIDNEEIELTKREAMLLEYFFRNPGIVLARETLLNEIWGFEFGGEDRAVDTLVTRLRKKIGKYSELIKSIRGVGYVFEKDKN